jgi:predicted RecB family endonuclease
VTDYSGNKALAGDIVVEVMTSLSDAVISSFQWCDDLSIPLSSDQKKQIFNAYVSVIMDMRERVHTIIELDDLAREFVGDSDGVKGNFKEITVDIDSGIRIDLED